MNDARRPPVPLLPGRTDLVTLALASVLLGLVFLLYHFFGVTDVGYDIKDTTRSAFIWLFERWQGDYVHTWFAHSHWVPLVSLWLVWRDRRALARLERRIWWPGVAAVLLALAMHWAGAKSQQTRLTVLSMIALSWSLPLFLFGWPTARRLLFPCGLLVFALPLNFFDAAAYPLRILSATLVSGIANGLGLEVTRAGATILPVKLADAGIALADSRSGIFAVTAAVAFAAVAGEVARTSLVRRIGLVALAVPLVVAANTVRGLLGVLAVAVAGGPAGAAFFEAVSGPVVVLILFGTPAWLAWKGRRPAEAGTPAAQPNGRTMPALLTAIVLLAGAIAWIPTNLTITHLDEAGVTIDLPEQVGSWRGTLVLFCHNPADEGEVLDSGLQPGDACPRCGQPLQEMSAIERSLLPHDTVLRKKRYEYANGRAVYLSIVLSGKDRSSIHRPEVCLVGPNSQIARSFVHRTPLRDGRALDVTILEMVLSFPGADGRTRTVHSYYAYWFAGIGQETPSHYQRMWWMARDRLFFNRSHRWAYLSLAGIRAEGGRDYLAEVDEFLREAHPLLVRPERLGIESTAKQ